MLNENARKWVDALRSGEYPQTTGRLADEDGYCCLGVACELYQREVGDLTKTEDADGPYFNNHSIFLPPAVQHWLGLCTYNGGFIETEDDGGCHTTLADLNDGGITFNEIAAVIESEPRDLFGDDRHVIRNHDEP